MNNCSGLLHLHQKHPSGRSAVYRNRQRVSASGAPVYLCVCVRMCICVCADSLSTQVHKYCYGRKLTHRLLQWLKCYHMSHIWSHDSNVITWVIATHLERFHCTLDTSWHPSVLIWVSYADYGLALIWAFFADYELALIWVSYTDYELALTVKWAAQMPWLPFFLLM